METIYLVDARVFYVGCGLVALGFAMIFHIGQCTQQIIKALKDKDGKR